MRYKTIREQDMGSISLISLADDIASKTENLLKKANTEEDLRIGFEKLLDPIKERLGVKAEGKYERSVLSGRSDAVHGQLIIEYEKTGSFLSKTKLDHAYKQLVNYLTNESKEINSARLIGVGFDGQKIFFVQYQGKTQDPIDSTKFYMRGPYDFDVKSARTFLIHLRALARRPLIAENISQEFGPKRDLASKMVCALVNALKYWGNQTHIRTFFNEWKRLFGIVYGEQFEGEQKKGVQSLSSLYKIGAEIDFQEGLFAVHTYFAFLMKMIAAEILTLRETDFGSSFVSELAHSSDDELKERLEDIENGGIYARKGVSNFLEGDFFRWYLDCFDSPELRDAIRDIAAKLSEFEPATTILDPSATRDLLKKLYQNLVPQEVRHRLGEYYTPDWLAELLLNEVGYNGNTRKRFLDPACGSGTFLVLAIQRAIKHGQEKEKLKDIEIAKRVVSNIWGFDLNPLAVIAARTNYIFALGDLVNELENFELPIYLADSVLWAERSGQMMLKPVGESIEIQTSLGKPFFVPKIWVSHKGFLMSEAAPLIEEMAKNRYSVDEAMIRLKKEGLVFPPHDGVVKNFYNDILELEEQNKNGIWARFLKNAFAPMVAGKFDFVVGNPPWIRWDYLSKEYRKATLQLWKDYGLFSLKGFQGRLGGGKKDFSMLFVYASSDYYLKYGSKLGFLITQEVLKAKGAGEGFRRFQLGDKKYIKVMKAHDFVSIQPFEGATNKTAAIILKKGEKTVYPVPYFVWVKKKSAGKIATDKLLDEVLPLLQKKRYIANPIGSILGAWQTQLENDKELTNVEGKNFYKAILGANPNPYGVFWLEIKQALSDGNIIVRNLTEKGKQKIQSFEERIEPDLIYPAVRGSDIERWAIQSKIYMLVVQDPKTRRGYPEEFLKNNYPRTYGYLIKFKEILLQRSLYKKYHEQAKAPFYSQFNISEETFARYKVVWKRMTNDLIAAVISQFKTPFGYKTIIPLETTALIATNNESEAHYLCAIINSKPVRDFIKSFSSAGRGFGTPSVMEHIGIPKFDPKNQLHQKLSDISKKCHELKLEGKDMEINKLEKENDNLVKKFFSIK